MYRDLRSATDETLVAILVEQGDENACDELYGRYQQKVYLWCYSYTHDIDEAVDCTQEIFIRIFRSLGSFRGGARLSTWIYQIARNHCLSRLSNRRHQWRQRLLPIEDHDAVDHSCSDSLRDAELKGQLDHLLQAANRTMKPQELEAFVLHYRDGFTVKEITRTLGCQNVSGARTLIQGARRKFQRLIAGKEYQGD